MEDTIKVVSKNQYLLYLIYETMFYDLHYRISKLKLEPNSLTFTINDFHDVNIKIYNNVLVLCIDGISKLEENINHDVNIKIYNNVLVLCIDGISKLEENINNDIFNSILSILLNNLNDYDIVPEFTHYDLFFKFIKLSSLFELEYTINKNHLSIYNKCNSLKLLVTLKDSEPNVYKIRIKRNEETLEESLLEYNNKINELSKFYDIDKSQQIVGLISRLF